jgi:hypothetical protein
MCNWRSLIWVKGCSGDVGDACRICETCRVSNLKHPVSLVLRIVHFHLVNSTQKEPSRFSYTFMPSFNVAERLVLMAKLLSLTSSKCGVEWIQTICDSLLLLDRKVAFGGGG